MRIFNQKYIYIYAKIKMSAINNFSGLCLDISVMVCMTWICGFVGEEWEFCLLLKGLYPHGFVNIYEAYS